MKLSDESSKVTTIITHLESIGFWRAHLAFLQVLVSIRHACPIKFYKNFIKTVLWSILTTPLSKIGTKLGTFREKLDLELEKMV